MFQKIYLFNYLYTKAIFVKNIVLAIPNNMPMKKQQSITFRIAINVTVLIKLEASIKTGSFIQLKINDSRIVLKFALVNEF